MASSTPSSSGYQRKRPDLALIFCPDCRWRTVMELTSRTEKNPNKVFFTCPNQQRGKEEGKKGCEFYLWEEEYEKYLELNHGVKSERVQSEIGGGAIMGGGLQERAVRSTDEDEEIGLLGNAVNKGFDQEICILLKALLAVGVVSLVVMICILVVVIMK